MRQASIQLIPTAQPMDSIITSTGVNLISIYAFSIQAIWTGGTDPVGTFTLEASNDPGEPGAGQVLIQPTKWTTISDSSQMVSNTPGSVLYDVAACGYRWVRLVYIPGSGSGNLTAIMNVKGV